MNDRTKKQNLLTNHFYADEDRRIEPKRYFVKLVEMLLEEDILKKGKSYCDIGCATGDYLWYLSLILKEMQLDMTLFGYDCYEELLEVAQERLKNIVFNKFDFLQEEQLEITNSKKFDIISCMGVLYLYEDFYTALLRLLGMLNSGGVLYIFTLFTEGKYDVVTNYGVAGEPYEGKIVQFSKTAVVDFLNKHGNNLEFEFIPFQIDIQMEKKEGELRSWTIPIKDGTFGIINGLNIWHQFYFLKIQMKE